jgi:glycosyltransferase involved in cell wall biosynthesis
MRGAFVKRSSSMLRARSRVEQGRMMSEANLFLDLTEVLANPLRTGIQRVEREIIRHWPGPARLVPCRFDPASRRFVAISDRVLEILSTDSTPPGAAELDLLRPHLNPLRSISPEELANGLFNPEVFFDPRRAAAYGEICRQDGARVSWLVFDFLPYLRPEDYPPGTARDCMPYVRAMRSIPRVGFISAQTQAEYARIMRDPTRAGPYFPLGGDALGTDKQSFSPDKNSFAYIGTIEPRKNVAVILEAFERLWTAGAESELILVGRLDSRSEREARILKRLAAERRLKYLGHADDATVRATLRKARATLFLSAAEGFGIPPYESLAHGVPAIVSAHVPSTNLLAPGGRITLAAVTPGAIIDAVRAMLDDQVAARLFEEARQLTIPSWRGFASDLGAWVQAA